MAALGFDRLDVSDLFGSSNLAIDRSRDHRRRGRQAGAGGAARFVEPLLFRVSGTDGDVRGGGGGPARRAGSLPARRVTRVDPREALQAE
jgi:hypothetical protein